MKNSGNLSLPSFSWSTPSQALQYLVIFLFLLTLRSCLFNQIPAHKQVGWSLHCFLNPKQSLKPKDRENHSSLLLPRKARNALKAVAIHTLCLQKGCSLLKCRVSSETLCSIYNHFPSLFWIFKREHLLYNYLRRGILNMIPSLLPTFISLKEVQLMDSVG